MKNYIWPGVDWLATDDHSSRYIRHQSSSSLL